MSTYFQPILVVTLIVPLSKSSLIRVRYSVFHGWARLFITTEKKNGKMEDARSKVSSRMAKTIGPRSEPARNQNCGFYKEYNLFNK